MALIGNMINEAYSSHRSVSDINYVLAASSFAAFTLVFYLIPANFSDDIYFHPAISTVVDTLTMLLLFAAAVALPSKLHADSCSNHVRHPSPFLFGSVPRSSNFPIFGIRKKIADKPAELPQQQLHHPRGSFGGKTLPRSPGLLCLPLVRLVRLLSLARHRHLGMGALGTFGNRP